MLKKLAQAVGGAAFGPENFFTLEHEREELHEARVLGRGAGSGVVDREEKVFGVEAEQTGSVSVVGGARLIDLKPLADGRAGRRVVGPRGLSYIETGQGAARGEIAHETAHHAVAGSKRATGGSTKVGEERKMRLHAGFLLRAPEADASNFRFSYMNGRLIAIGDIHGCAAEFAELLAQLAPTRADRLVLVGDLVNRGPDSRKVIELARAHRAVALLGNHELRLLKYRRTGDRKYVKEKDLDTFDRLQAADWDFLEAMPLTFEEPNLDVVCVHGGFLPDRPWRKQPAEVVTRIQVVDRDGRAAKRADAPGSPLWADLWSGPPFVIYGHTPRSEVYKRKWSAGIDTACVMGGSLTAYVLPEREFVQVKARKKYYP